MAEATITITIEDPAPVAEYGRDIAIFKVETEVDGQKGSTYLSAMPTTRGDAREETIREATEVVEALIRGGGRWPT